MFGDPEAFLHSPIQIANMLEVLEVGKFEDVETEASVGTRRADIVAVGEDGTLVVENQFGKADWDHWGRLEAYARLTRSYGWLLWWLRTLKN